MRLSPAFLIKFFALAAIFFALWSFAGVSDAYGRFIVAIARPLVETLTDCQVAEVKEGPKGIAVLLSRTDPQGKLYTRAIPLLPREVFSGIIPYLALMLATPGLAALLRGRQTAIGMGIFVVFHVGLILIGTYLTGLPQAHLAPETIRGVVQPMVNVVYGFYGLIGYAALPFLLWFWLGARASGMLPAWGSPAAPAQGPSRAERRRGKG